MIRSLVTGGCGFIGSNFIRYILRNRPEVSIINLDRLTYAGNPANLFDIDKEYRFSRYRFIKGDIGDRDVVENIFRSYDVDWVINFAAESHVDRSIDSPAEFLATNVLGTFCLLEAARKFWLGSSVDISRKRFLHISTDEVYGSLDDTGYFTEATPYNPSSPYSASKAASDHLVYSYCKTYSLPTMITNSSNNYGPFQFPEKLIPLMITHAIKGKKLPVYGDGKNIRDWIYVEDHCKAILAVLEGGVPGQKYNVGANCEKRNIDLVTMICDYLDDRIGLIYGKPRTELIEFVTDRLGHDRRYAIETSKIRRDLQWKPEVSFENGIIKTIDWYLNNLPWVENIETGRYRSFCGEQK